MRRIPGSLEALLSNLIDYAGLYPPAALPLPVVTERFGGFLASPEKWMLNRLVLAAARLGEVDLRPSWRVTLLVDEEPGALPPQVETLETRLPQRLSLPTYCEAPLERISGAFAKVRTGGLMPEVIPSTSQLAGFLCEAVSLRTAFKATAGLHHPIRGVRPLSYTPDSPRATMHGFLNVFVAAAFAWHGAGREELLGALEETDARKFEFALDGLMWRGRRLTTDQIREARRDFAHSFGSCSFEEPVSELRELELIP
jgi:hypothetical protein